MKCLIILYFVSTNTTKEMIFHASSCESVYEMVVKKVDDPNVEVLMISENPNATY